MERIRINLLNALRNGYGFKTAAIVERFKAYTRYAIGNYYIGKVGAIIEGLILDIR